VTKGRSGKTPAVEAESRAYEDWKSQLRQREDPPARALYRAFATPDGLESELVFAEPASPRHGAEQAREHELLMLAEERLAVWPIPVGRFAPTPFHPVVLEVRAPDDGAPSVRLAWEDPPPGAPALEPIELVSRALADVRERLRGNR
jgi:hypothetical protein